MGHTTLSPQAMLGALEAIRGHKSAHSLATGPVTVEPGAGRTEKGENVCVQSNGVDILNG